MWRRHLAVDERDTAGPRFVHESRERNLRGVARPGEHRLAAEQAADPYAVEGADPPQNRRPIRPPERPPPSRPSCQVSKECAQPSRCKSWYARRIAGTIQVP